MQALKLLGIPKNSKHTWSPNFLFPEIPKNAKIILTLLLKAYLHIVPVGMSKALFVIIIIRAA